jgi:hypothetical protein
MQSVAVNLCREQYQQWAGLSFITSIANGPLICQSLSTPQWIEILLKVVSCEDMPNSAVYLPRRVR